jgi:hypothetical protein
MLAMTMLMLRNAWQRSKSVYAPWNPLTQPQSSTLQKTRNRPMLQKHSNRPMPAEEQ